MGLPPEGPNASSVCCHPAICVSGPTWDRENVNLKRPRFVIMLKAHVTPSFRKPQAVPLEAWPVRVAVGDALAASFALGSARLGFKATPVVDAD